MRVCALSLVVVLGTVEAQECDPNGRYHAHLVSHLPWSGTRLDDAGTQWVFETDQGRFGVADLESRNLVFQLPRLGDRIQTFRAELLLEGKVLHRNHWVYNLDSGSLISITSVVSIVLDLDARRSAPIPETMREALQKRYRPELG